MAIGPYRAQAHLIMGAKAYFFGVPAGEAWQYSLTQCLHGLKQDAPVLVTFGEIDCRPNEGIMQQCINNPAYALEQEVETLVRGYVKCLHKAKGKRRGPIIISGVPAPAQEKSREVAHGFAPRFVEVISRFNRALATAARDYGLAFMDVYAHTDRGDGWAKPNMHLDGVHLNPNVVIAALEKVLPA
jgi:lysophospholipase L1-like esterase